MSRLKNKRAASRCLPFAAFLSAVLFCGCGFADLRPLTVQAFPAAAGTVLPERDTAVSLRFNTAMERRSAESIFSVSSWGASVSGDISWYGNELRFNASKDWDPGVRYTLNFAGTAAALDGREQSFALHIPFYAVKKQGAPYCTGFSPAAGGSAAAGKGLTLVLEFSVPMDTQSVEDAFSVDGSPKRTAAWSDDRKKAEFVFTDPLEPLRSYSWKLGTAAKSSEGIPLVRETAAVFFTDADNTAPYITGVYPVINTGALSWQRSGLDLENGLGPGQGIEIQWSEPMGVSAADSIRFIPALPGKTIPYGTSSVLFIPDKDPVPQQIYTMIVSAEAKDLSGIKMQGEQRFVFTPDIQFLKLVSPAPDKTVKTRAVKPDGIIAVTLRFSQGFEKSTCENGH